MISYLQEIKYNGFTADTSDYECADGELATSMGLVPEDGALKPALPPKIVFPLKEGQKVVFIHQTSDYKHYIIQDSQNGIYYNNDGTAGKFPPYPDTQPIYTISADIYGFNAVGNTLIVLTSQGMDYYLWKPDVENKDRTRGNYIHLGTHIPELPISFGLQGEVKRTDWYDINDDYLNNWDGKTDQKIIEDKRENVTATVMSQVNKFIADNSTNAGRFLFPFFVRYAYRLYDGSLTMHSAPILMVGMTPRSLFCMTQQGNLKRFRVVGVPSQLDYQFADADLEKLKDWKDIVSSVDIFVSAPIYTHNQAGQCEKCGPMPAKGNFEHYFFDGKVSDLLKPFPGNPGYEYRELDALYERAFNNDIEDNYWSGYQIYLPEKTTGKIRDDIVACAQFYFLKSVLFEDLSSDERVVIEIPEDYLQSLTAREVMTDDYDSHDTLIPKYSFGYNSRFNIANLKKQLFRGFHPKSMVPCSTETFHDQVGGTKTFKIEYLVNDDMKTIRVMNSETVTRGTDSPFPWLYYPNSKAFMAFVTVDNTTHYIKLTQHPTLNGAYAFNDLRDITGKETSSYTGDYTDDDKVNLPNKLYTSEVNDPFNFPLLGINTVGTGEILGICSAAKALSQGQFGQFPLYVFATDGVWAMEVSDTGTYSARQPITRDVCVSPESITQLDSEVAFATDRGIMLLSGSDAVCMSDEINSNDYFTVAELPMADRLMEGYNGINAYTGEKETSDSFSLIPFGDFLKGCRMAYDYVNQRILAYNPSVSYAYVYSISSKLWGMMKVKLTNNVNSYPDALAMMEGIPKYYLDENLETDTTDNALVDLSHPGAERVTALAVTRPFKLGAPDVLKTVDTVIQRGYFRRDHVSQVLYGSRDLFNWHVVWSSTDKYLRGLRGTPYKYFRLALVCKLDKEESIYGCTVQFTPRLTNKPR